jgi:hypothetical protein
VRRKIGTCQAPRGRARTAPFALGRSRGPPQEGRGQVCGQPVEVRARFEGNDDLLGGGLAGPIAGLADRALDPRARHPPKRLDRAQRRHLAALRALATAQRLLPAAKEEPRPCGRRASLGAARGLWRRRDIGTGGDGHTADGEAHEPEDPVMLAEDRGRCPARDRDLRHRGRGQPPSSARTSPRTTWSSVPRARPPREAAGGVSCSSGPSSHRARRPGCSLRPPPRVSSSTTASFDVRGVCCTATP